MKISIFASIWAQNLWDELILKNEIKLLEDEFWKETKFFVFSYDYKNPFFVQDNVKYIEYFPIWIKEKRNIFRNIFNFFRFINISSNSDVIVIWWGWIIYDKEKQTTKNPLDSWIFRRRIFRFFLKKVYFFAIWINIKDEKNLKKIKKIFKNSYKVTVRDGYSFWLLRKLKIKSEYVKDPVFYDNWGKLKDKKSYLIKNINSFDFTFEDLKGIDFNWKKVGLALRYWYLYKSGSKLDSRFEEWKINQLINYILKNGWEIVFLPHSFHKTDLIANDFLYLESFLRKWEEKMTICNSMQEVYDCYKNKSIDICLAMRLHSIILSQVYEIPFVWISYSTKTDEILDNLI